MALIDLKIIAEMIPCPGRIDRHPYQDCCQGYQSGEGFSRKGFNCGYHTGSLSTGSHLDIDVLAVKNIKFQIANFKYQTNHNNLNSKYQTLAFGSLEI